jgi:SOS-response transcriptional repressor LexA
VDKGRTPPTERQLDVLTVIHRSIERNGWAPTVAEICAEIGTTSKYGAWLHLKGLEKRALIVRGEHARSIRITDAGRKQLRRAS